MPSNARTADWAALGPRPSTTRQGVVPILTGDPTEYLDSTGNWSRPGNVTGSAPTTPGNVAVFDDTTGRIIIDGGPAFVNPMTNIGEMIGGGVGGIPTRIPENAGTRRQWLAEAGTGIAGTLPGFAYLPTLYVADFGGQGGGADDTAAYQAAINTAGAIGGGRIVMLASKSRISSSLILPTTDGDVSIMFQGQGTNCTILSVDQNVTLFVGAGGTVRPYGYSFEDFWVFYSSQCTSGAVFQIPSIHRLLFIRNIQIRNSFDFLQMGADVSNAVNGAVASVYIRDIYTVFCAGSIILLQGACGNIDIKGITAIASAVSTSQVIKVPAVHTFFQGVDVFIMRDCDFESFTNGILLDTVGIGGWVDCLFDFVILDGITGSHGFSITSTNAASGTPSSARIKLRNMWITTTGVSHDGLHLDSDFHGSVFGVLDISVLGSNISGTNGIYVGAATDIQIDGNQIYGGCTVGVRLASTSGDTMIGGGNRIGNVYGVGNTTGIQIDAGALTWFIEGNDCHGNTTNLTNNGGASNGTTRVITNNKGVNPFTGSVFGRIILASNFAVGSGSASEAAIIWSSAAQDDAGCWASGSPTLLTVPSGCQRMKVWVPHRWDANATGSRVVKIKDNAGNTWAESGYGTVTMAAVPAGGCCETAMLEVAALGITSFIVSGTQDSGGALNFRGNTAGSESMVCYEIRE